MLTIAVIPILIETAMQTAIPCLLMRGGTSKGPFFRATDLPSDRSEEHTSELQSHSDLVCRLLLEKKKTRNQILSAPFKRRTTYREVVTNILRLNESRLTSSS